MQSNKRDKVMARPDYLDATCEILRAIRNLVKIKINVTVVVFPNADISHI